MRAGLYIHVPFCRRKCPYCSFFSRPPKPGDFARFEEAVSLHLRAAAASPEVARVRFATVFLGGGTPSVLPTAILTRILREARQLPAFPQDAEISVEVNPGTVDAETLAELRRAGFNRLSIGVQSFLDHELRRLGRIHSAAEAQHIALAARRAGFDNINLDLMYGLPGQGVADWQENLETALALAPEHLALYELTPEAPSPLFDAVQRGDIRLPDEDTQLAMLATTQRLMQGSGLVRYEISNYARPGRECRHNLNYWENGEYLGLGPGAVSAFVSEEGGIRRLRVPPDLAAYHRRVLAGTVFWEEDESPDVEAAFRESVALGLRMIRGVSAEALRLRFGFDVREYYGPTLERLITQGLVARQDGRLALTASGLLLANQVMAELI